VSSQHYALTHNYACAACLHFLRFVFAAASAVSVGGDSHGESEGGFGFFMDADSTRDSKSGAGANTRLELAGKRTGVTALQPNAAFTSDDGGNTGNEEALPQGMRKYAARPDANPNAVVDRCVAYL
jgi:hypothetical protein